MSRSSWLVEVQSSGKVEGFSGFSGAVALRTPGVVPPPTRRITPTGTGLHGDRPIGGVVESEAEVVVDLGLCCWVGVGEDADDVSQGGDQGFHLFCGQLAARDLLAQMGSVADGCP